MCALRSLAIRTGFVGLGFLGGGSGLPTAQSGGEPSVVTEIERYTITDLGAYDPVGYYGSARAINDNGIVVGSEKRPDNKYDPLLWVNGSKVVLPRLGGTEGFAYDVNNSRQVAGWTDNVDYRDRAVRWTDRVPQDLGAFPGGLMASRAFGINDLGHVVGWSYINTGWRRAFFHDGTTMRHIPAFDNAHGEGWSLNEDDMVVGYCDYGLGKERAFSWQAGVFTTHAGPPGCEHSFAFDVNASGTIAGHCDLPGVSCCHATLWRGEEPEILDTPGSGSARVHAINDAGQVVGKCHGSAFLRANGAFHYLDNLLPGNHGWHLDEAFDINEFGQIVGNGTFNGSLHGFMLSPLPFLLVTDTAQPSDSLDLRIEGRTGAPYVVAWAPDAGPIAVPGLPFTADLGPSLGSVVLQFFGVVPAAGFDTHNLATPPDATLLGQDYFWQAYTFADGKPRKSNRTQLLFRL